MTALTIRLSPDTERKLREQAAHAGKSLEGYVEELATRAAATSATNGTTSARPELSAEEWVAQWRAWFNRQPVRPVIADDSRESIYGAGKP